MEWTLIRFIGNTKLGGIDNMFESRLAIQKDLRQAGGMGQKESCKTKQRQIQPLATGKAEV